MRFASRSFPRRAVIVRSGLGVGTVAGVQAGSAIVAAAGATGPAAPIVAAVGTVVSLLSSFIGGGCGQACVQASQAQQIYEYAGQCLDAVAADGQLGQSDLTAGLETFLSAGVAHMQSLGSSSEITKGTTNLSNALNSDIKAASSIPATAPKPLNINEAPSLFPSTSGWYAASAQAGAQLAMAYLQSLPSASGTSVNLSTGAVSVAGMTFSFADVLLLAGAGLLVWMVI